MTENLKYTPGCNNVDLTKDHLEQLEKKDTLNTKGKEAETGFIRKNAQGKIELLEPAEKATEDEKKAFEQFKKDYQLITGKDIGQCSEAQAEEAHWGFRHGPVVRTGYANFDLEKDGLPGYDAFKLQTMYGVGGTYFGGGVKKFHLGARIGLDASFLGTQDFSALGDAADNTGGVKATGNAGAKDPSTCFPNADGEIVCDNAATFDSNNTTHGGGNMLGLRLEAYAGWEPLSWLGIEAGYGLTISRWETDNRTPLDISYGIGTKPGNEMNDWFGHGPMVSLEFLLDKANNARLGAWYQYNMFKGKGINTDTGEEINDFSANEHATGLSFEYRWGGEAPKAVVAATPTPVEEKCEDGSKAVADANKWLTDNKANLEKIGLPKEVTLEAYYLRLEDTPGKTGSGATSTYRVVLAAKQADGSKVLLINNTTNDYATIGDFQADIAKEASTKSKTESAQKVISLLEQLIQFTATHPNNDEADLIAQVAAIPNITADQFQGIMVAKNNPFKGRPIVNNKAQVENTIVFAQNLKSLIEEAKSDKNVRKISVIVEGHASKTGPEPKNQIYSTQRAAAEAAILKSHGIENIESIGFGSTASDPAIGRPKDAKQQRVIVKIKVEYADGSVQIDTAKDFAIKSESKIKSAPDVDINSKYSGMSFDDNGDGTYTEVMYRRDGNDGSLGNVYRSSQDKVSLDKCAGKDFVSKNAKPNKASIDENIKKATAVADAIIALPTTKPVSGMNKGNMDTDYKVAERAKVALKRVRGALYSIQANADEAQKVQINALLEKIRTNLESSSAVSGYVNDIIRRRLELNSTKALDEGASRARGRRAGGASKEPKAEAPKPEAKPAAPVKPAETKPKTSGGDKPIAVDPEF